MDTIKEAALYHKNPRTISEKQFADLGKWMVELGDLGGIIHDLNSNEIIGGNQRSRVLQAKDSKIEIVEKFDPPTKTGTVAHGFILLDGEKFAYRQVRWTPKQCEQACICANHAGGDWSWSDLAANFEIEDLLDWGFTEDELGGASDPAHVPEDVSALNPVFVDLWAAINEYATACGGDTTNATAGARREAAVVEVEREARALMAAASDTKT
jgi:hypothetical protein